MNNLCISAVAPTFVWIARGAQLFRSEGCAAEVEETLETVSSWVSSAKLGTPDIKSASKTVEVDRNPPQEPIK